MASLPLKTDSAAHRYDYKIHPLANLFPEMSAEDFKKLKRDIELNHQVESIMLSADGETLLDGRHRLRACKELGRLPRTERYSQSWLDEQFNGKTSAQSEADYIWAKNVSRRHLTADQRAAIALKWSDGEKEAAKERQKATLKKGDKLPVRADSPTREKSDRHATRTALAKSAQTSTHKIRQAETVKKRAPHLIPKVAAGEIKLKDAIKQVTTKPDCLSPRSAADQFIKASLGAIDYYREKVDPREHERFNTLVADGLEVVARRVAGAKNLGIETD